MFRPHKSSKRRERLRYRTPDGLPSIISRIEHLEARCLLDVSISISDPVPFMEADSGTGNMMFVVSRTGDTAVDVSVDFHTIDGLAHAGVDYQATSGTLLFVAEELVQTITVPVIGNTRFEGNRAFTVAISDPLLLTSLTAKQAISVGNGPFAVTTADLNRDGRMDLAVANVNSDSVSVLLNLMAPGVTVASFSPQQTLSAGAGPIFLAAADFNGDGTLDLAVANSMSDSVSLILNQTAPGATQIDFATHQTLATGSRPSSVIAADLNGDGRPDLAVSSLIDNSLSVLFNQTAPGATQASFITKQTIATGGGPRSVTAADFNGDGRLDLAVANRNANSISVMLNRVAPGDTQANFASQQTFAAGVSPVSVTATDLNGDGRPDIAVANHFGGTVSIILNQSAPGATQVSFAPQQTLATGNRPSSVMAADLNGDGRLDLAIANYGSGSTSIMLNQTTPGATNASFAAQQTVATGNGPYSVTGADLNGDGRLDLVTADFSSASASVILNQTGAGAAQVTMTDDQAQPAGLRPVSVLAIDLNGDGRLDMAVANYIGDTVSVFLNRTTPGATTTSFSHQQILTQGDGPLSIAAVDLNGDGKMDLAVGHTESHSLSILLNQTAPGATVASFAIPLTLATADLPLSVTAADLNGDGRLDLVMVNQTSHWASIFLNLTAPGSDLISFASPQTFATFLGPFSLSVADLNSDGRLDLAAANVAGSSVSVLLNQTPPGSTLLSFAGQQTFATLIFPVAITAADVNGDGRLDLGVTNGADQSVSILLNQTPPGSSAASFFADQQTFSVGTNSRAITPAELNGDGRVDLVVANLAGATVTILLNQTAPGATVASFANQTLATGASPFMAIAADFNGDGRLDVASANGGADSVSVFLNQSTPLAIIQSLSTGVIQDDDAPMSIAVFQGDGQSANVNSQFSNRLSVLVRNANSNPVEGASVTFATPSSGASATLGGSVTVFTNASGVATSPVLTANAIPGDYTVTASVSGVPTSASFMLVNFKVSDDRYLLGSAAGSSTAATSVLVNDGAQQGISAAVTIATALGSAQLASDGTFTYVPGTGFWGVDQFSYAISNGAQQSSPATVTVVTHSALQVQKLYQQVLGRAVEPQGWEYWTRQVSAGTASLGTIASGIFESPERLDPIVAQMYRDYLFREADSEGLGYWREIWQHDGGPENVIAGIVSSPEFFNSAGGTNRLWVTEMYRRLLGREPDSQGLDFWTGQLNAGTRSREQVVLGFVESEENFRNLVRGWHLQYLSRPVTLIEENGYTSQLQVGASQRDIQIQLLNSSEYLNSPPPAIVGTARKL